MTGLTNSQMIAEIRAAITDGTLPYAEMKWRLTAAINAELSKTTEDADLELITACQSLLYEIHTHGTESYEDHTAQNLAGIQRKLKERLRLRSLRKHALRIAVTAASILLILFATEVLGYREWLDGASTDNEQDYVVKSNVVDPKAIQSGNAGADNEPREITSSDFNQARSIISFEPPIPSWIPPGWEAISYHAYSFDGYEIFYISYQSPRSEKRLRYEIHFSSESDVVLAVYTEQNEAGENISLENGLTVYLGVNLELPACVWTEGNMSFLLTGPLLQDDLIQMINSIKGEMKNEQSKKTSIYYPCLGGSSR